MKKLNVIKLFVILSLCNFINAQELAVVDVKKYDSIIKELSSSISYTEESLNDLQEGFATVKFKINDAYTIEKMEVVGDVSKDLKGEVKKSVQKYVTSKGNTLLD